MCLVFFQQLTKQNSILARQFIQPYEYSCIQLASKVRKDDPEVYILCTQENPETVAEIYGLVSTKNTVLHCLPFLSNTALRTPAQKALQALFGGKKVKCISGATQACQFIKEALGLEEYVSQKNSYRLMVLNGEPAVPPETLCNGDELRRCVDSDKPLLMDLQKEYLQTEVAPDGKKVGSLECALNLKQLFKNQLILSIFSDGEPVAKANTNAVGINWVQLGGVYTHPLYRRNHYAWILVESLCRRIIKSQKNVALYVKDINVPAIQLYKKIGFVEKENYEISYFAL